MEVHNEDGGNQRAYQRSVTMTLYEDAERVDSLKDLVGLVRALLVELEDDVDSWENPTLPSYLEALAAWLEDSPGFFERRNDEMAPGAGWHHFAIALVAAARYE